MKDDPIGTRRSELRQINQELLFVTAHLSKVSELLEAVGKQLKGERE